MTKRIATLSATLGDPKLSAYSRDLTMRLIATLSETLESRRDAAGREVTVEHFEYPTEE